MQNCDIVVLERGEQFYHDRILMGLGLCKGGGGSLLRLEKTGNCCLICRYDILENKFCCFFETSICS